MSNPSCRRHIGLSGLICPRHTHHSEILYVVISFSCSNKETSTAYSHPFSVRSLSSSLRKSSFLLLVIVLSFSFFISNMIETISVPFSSKSLKT